MGLDSRDEEAFPKLIRQIRANRELTQKEFGELFTPSVTQQSVAQWERGDKSPARKHWSTLAELAGIDLGQFYEFVERGSTSKGSLIDDLRFKIQGLTPEELKIVTQITAEQWAELDEGNLAANRQHLALLRRGVTAWNNWRGKNPNIQPDLSGADLRGGEFQNLSGIDLSGTKLINANLRKVNLSGAKLLGADLQRANLTRVNLNRADLQGASLRQADLSHGWLVEAKLDETDLKGGNFKYANLSKASLLKADLSEADLTGADLRWACLFETNLQRSTLVDCAICGISVWGVNLENAIQAKLSLSPEGNQVTSPDEIVDSLEFAQIVYLSHHDPTVYERLRQLWEVDE